MVIMSARTCQQWGWSITGARHGLGSVQLLERCGVQVPGEAAAVRLK